jgi:opine dehydrogenase
MPKTKKITVYGKINGEATLSLVTDDIAAAVEGAKYICVVTPSFAHENIAMQLKGIVKPYQTIVLYPGAFSSLVMRRILGEACPVIAEVNNLPYDTRIKTPGKVHCTGINPTNIAFLPAAKGREMLEELRKLHPFQRLYDDVLECGLSIVNPALHSGACLLNIGAIEQPCRGGFHMYEHFTPGAAKVDLALDAERKKIGVALGYKLRPIEDFAGKPEGYAWTWQDLYMQMHGDIALTQISGPNDIFNRYLTEDCPYGLVPWAALADALGIDTPIMDAIVNLYCLIHERDWRLEGRSLEQMGLNGKTKEEILKYVKIGN